MSGFDQYGGGENIGQGAQPEFQAPQSGIPQGMPGYPAAQPKKSSGCTGCLIGCLVALTIAVVLIGGSAWYAYSWFTDNIIVSEPLDIEPIEITEKEINRLEASLEKIDQSDADIKEIVLTDKELRYIILASLWSAENAPGEKMQFPEASEFADSEAKIDIDFTGEDTVDFKVSVPWSVIFAGPNAPAGEKDENGDYLNISCIMKLEINEENITLDFDSIKIGKAELVTGQEDFGNQMAKEQLANNPEAQELLELIKYLKIEDGKIKVKIAELPDATLDDIPSEKGY